MALQLPLFQVPGIVAGEDLSDHQFKFVTINNDGDAELVSTSNEAVFGILQNAPEQGEQCQIMVAGISKVQVDADGFSKGDYIVCDNDGLATAETVTDNSESHRVLGQAYLDGTDSTVSSIMFSTLVARAAE